MLPAPLPPVRRVVTANKPDGRSYIQEEHSSLVEMTPPGRPGYRNVNVWRTVGTPTAIDAADTIQEHSGAQPPADGTILRVIDFPPISNDPEERRRQASASLQTLFKDCVHDASHPNPGMHITRSVDYAIVLSGTITAVMDDGETDLHPGDILIQRGTNHAWENRTDDIARVAFVLIDGR
ncbi:cupin domain-containing protein [Sphingomonas sp. XMGL2]|uniref:Cupin domain-containing protein n=1 Tax=Sphingomonas quercus TaxID=2842451 RepID=A0ABS6BIL1_9SPHN|nr:cupin domain-containing protein [Sphingomonas quercus]MBU3077651.1 cupin domain-containing protein [Sphingomonas quercus]